MAGARPLRLPSGGRLKRASEFQAVFQRGSRVEREHFVALWRRADGAWRAGFAVTRKVRGAARRNRVRRRLREAYRQQLGTALPPGVSVVFVGRETAEAASFERLSGDIREALRAIAARARRGGEDSQ
jgi:ribonuclease P protein component